MGDSVIDLLINFIKNLSYSKAFLLFIFSFIIFSDIFVEYFVSKFNGAVSNGIPNTYGTSIQICSLCIIFLLMDSMVSTTSVSSDKPSD